MAGEDKPSCVRCGLKRRRRVRRLCMSCYESLRQRGELDEYPRVLRRRKDVAEDARFLAEQGCGEKEIRSRLNLRLYELHALLSVVEPEDR